MILIKTLVKVSLVATLLVVALLAGFEQEPLVVFDSFVHIGDTVTPEWTEASAQPEAERSYLFSFDAVPSSDETTLEWMQRDVDDPWTITLNGKRVTTLDTGTDRRKEHVAIPGGLLRKGLNRLEVATPVVGDDIIIGKVRLHYRSFREVLGLGKIHIRVFDASNDKGVPARITVADDKGNRPRIYFGESLYTAVRDGLIYESKGDVSFELPVGRYKVWATRGMEWSLGQTEVEIVPNEVVDVALPLIHEVDTTGWVAADTHLHTLTISGHGDSTLEERQVTLAGEGVELAIATDHNHNVDYTPYQQALGLQEHFTPVVGNELDNALGHFNAFPLDPNDEIPDRTVLDWVKWVDEIRSHGARVVILNHPRWPAIDDGPFSNTALDRITGERPGGEKFQFDAMELVNSTWILDDPLFKCVDWFALLNHGESIKAVGSSDSHTVGAPVGQGRTYVRSSTDIPSMISVDEACTAFLKGDISTSFGIFAEVRVNEDYGMGDTVMVADRQVKIALRVSSPSWIRPRRALIFINGEQVSEASVPTQAGKLTDEWLSFSVTTPSHDAWMVAVVLGDGVDGAYWPTMKDHTMAATNPIYLNNDGDAQWENPRQIAKRLIKKYLRDSSSLNRVKTQVDTAVRVQIQSLTKTD